MKNCKMCQYDCFYYRDEFYLKPKPQLDECPYFKDKNKKKGNTLSK